MGGERKRPDFTDVKPLHRSLVNPGENPSPHLHQIVGGNAFNQTMDHTTHDLPSTATCTSCTPTEDFSNYWTATLFFRFEALFSFPFQINRLG